MYEVCSRVHGQLTFFKVGKAFEGYGQKSEINEKDIKDPEVQRAIRDGRLDVVAERVAAPDPIKESLVEDMILSKKDWQEFRKILLEAADHVADRLEVAIREELSKIPPPGVSTIKHVTEPVTTRKRVSPEEVQYVFTPKPLEGDSKVEAEESSEGGEDLAEGLEALRRLRKAK